MRRWPLALMLCLCLSTVARAGALLFDDTLASQQDYLQQMSFPQAWDVIFNQPKRGQVTVAVLDSGFDMNHVDLSANLTPGYDVITQSSDVSPVNAHGTATAGIIGAKSGNAQGISQAAWTASVLPIRVTNREDGGANASDIAKGIRIAADKGARVISISYSGVDLAELNRAARYANRKGAMVFIAAGNGGDFKPNWRNFPFLQAIGSVAADNQLSDFSNFGRFVDFVAPGEDIITLNTGNQYASWSGTSFSTPIAASAASLVLTANPYLSPNQVLRILRRTATDLGIQGKDNLYGFGMPDVLAAVEMAIDTRGIYKNRLRRLGFGDPMIYGSLADSDGILSDELGGLLPAIDVTGSEALSVLLLSQQAYISSDLASLQSEAPRSVPTPTTAMIIFVALLLQFRLRPRRNRAA